MDSFLWNGIALWTSFLCARILLVPLCFVLHLQTIFSARANSVTWMQKYLYTGLLLIFAVLNMAWFTVITHKSLLSLRLNYGLNNTSTMMMKARRSEDTRKCEQENDCRHDERSQLHGGYREVRLKSVDRERAWMV